MTSHLSPISFRPSCYPALGWRRLGFTFSLLACLLGGTLADAQPTPVQAPLADAEPPPPPLLAPAVPPLAGTTVAVAKSEPSPAAAAAIAHPPPPASVPTPGTAPAPTSGTAPTPTPTPGTAPADPIEQSAEAQVRAYLILGLTNQGQGDSELRQHLAAVIGQSYGSARLPALRATTEELYCRDVGCFQALADQLGAYDIAISGELRSQSLPSGKTAIRLVLFNRNRALAAVSQGTLQADCSPQLRDRTACREQLTQFVQQKALRAAPKLKRKPELPTYLSFERGLAQGIGLGVSISGLVAGSAVSFMQGRTYPSAVTGGPEFTVQGLDPIAKAGFGFMGIGLSTLAASSLYGVWRAPFVSASPQQRSRYALGLLMGAAGSMFLGSLIGAIGIHAQEAHCFDNSNLRCSFPGPSGVAWTMTAVWGVSLAISGIALKHLPAKKE